MKARKYNIRFARGVVLYLWITYFLYLLLPIQKTGYGELYTILFLSFVSFAFYFGCKSVPIKRSVQENIESTHLILKEVPLQILLLLCTLFTIMYMRDMLSQGLGSLSLDIGENYVAYQEAESRYNSVWGRFYVLFSPARFFLVAYCTIVFKRIRVSSRILYFAFLLSTFLHSLMQGKNVGLGYIVFIIGVAYFLVCLNEHKIKQYKRFILIGGGLFVLYFVFSITLRVEAYGGSLEDAVINPDSWLIRVFGVRGGVGIMRLLTYFSHGYRGLSYCLQLPFVWTNGYGGAMGLDSYITQYFRVESQLPYTYPARMEDVFGYSGLTSWPTVFPWWASDLSYPGVVVFMYLIGRFLCVLFRESYYHHNQLAAVLFSYFSIAIVCLPLNNQLLQTRPTFLTTVFFLFLWFVSRFRVKA